MMTRLQPSVLGVSIGMVGAADKMFILALPHSARATFVIYL